MVVDEVGLTYSARVSETVVGIVQSCEQVNKIESDLVQTFLFGKYIWMSLRVEFGFNFVKRELSVTVGVDMFESVLYKTHSGWRQWSQQVV